MDNPKIKVFSKIKSDKKLEDYDFILFDKEENP